MKIYSTANQVINSNISVKPEQMRRKDRVEEHEGGKPAASAASYLEGLGGASMMVGLIHFRIPDGSH